MACSITTRSVTEGINNFIKQNAIGKNKGLTYGDNETTLRVTDLKKAQDTRMRVNKELGGEALVPSFQFPNSVFDIKVSSQLIEAQRKLLEEQEYKKSFERDVHYFNGDQALFEQEQKGYLQSGAIPSKASDVTTAKLEEWLKGIGINPQEIKPIMDGKTITGRAMIDSTGALVQYSGDKNIVLPEEAMHIAVEILEKTNPSLFNQMLNKIGKYNMYQKVREEYDGRKEYQKDGKPDIRKLKKEAIAKVLVEQFILKDDGQVENPDNLLYSQSWWDKVVDFFKDIFFGENYNPFAVASEAVTNLTAAQLEETVKASKGEEFFQLSDDAKAIQAKITTAIDQKLKDFQVRKVTGKAEFEDQDDINFYERLRGGKLGKVAKRVTDFVKAKKSAAILAKFENAPPEKKNEWKQKAEWGTKFHADAENIINAALDSDGRLKKHSEINFGGIVSNLGGNAQAELISYLIGTEQVPGLLYVHFPEGTVFRTEQMVYDDNRDVAGTIDLMGITPEGKIRIFDWKTKFLNLSKNSDVPWYSQGDYRLQLDQYSTMLAQYGLKKSDVEVAQAMPIIFSGSVSENTGNVSNVTMTLPAINYKEENRRYLLPVPVESQSSGNELLDDYIAELNNLYKVLFARKTENKELKNEQLNAIAGAIRELQVRQNFGPLAEQGEVFIKGAEASIAELNNVFKDEKGNYVDFSTLDKEVVDTMLDNLKIQDENIHKYTDMYSTFVDIYGKEDLSEEEEETLLKLKDLAGDSQVVEKQIKKERSKFVAWVAENRTGVKGILTSEKPVRGIIDRTISEISKIQTKGLNVLRALTSRAKNDSKIKFDEESKKFEKILEKFKAHAEATGLSVREYFSLITEKNDKGEPTNKLVRQYKKEFTTGYEAAISGGKADVAWLKANIDTAAFTKYAEERFESIAADIDKAIYPHGSLEELDEIREEKKKQAYKRFDLSTSDSEGWYHPAMKKFPQAHWTNEEYTRIQNTPALADMYNFIFSLNEHAKQVGYHDSNYQFSRTFLPWMKASTLDNIRTSGISSIPDTLNDYFKLTPEEEISYVKVDPNTGTIERSIPAYFTKGDFAKNEEGEYDLSKISTDLGKTISMYMAAVYEYESLSNIEALAKSVLDIEKTKNALLVDDRGKIVMKDGTTDPELTNNSENAKLYESFLDSLLYKRQDSGQSGLSPEQAKLVDKANNFFRMKVFGLNIFTPMTMLVGGNFQALINGSKLWRGREWLANEGKIVASAFKGEEGNLEKGLIDYFLPFTENVSWEKARRMSLDKIQRWSFGEVIMSPIRKADRVVQMATALTMLENSVLVDGKIINARKYIADSAEYRARYKMSTADRKAMEAKFDDMVKEALEKDGLKKKIKFNAEGVLEIEGVDRMSETVYNTRLAILNEIKSITGALSEEDKRDGDRSVLVRSMLMFKNWIVPMASVRFQDIKYNVDVNEYEMGRIRMMFQIIKNGDGKHIKGVVQGIKDLIDMNAGNERGVKLLAEYFRKTKESYKARTGKDLEITEEEFFDMTRRYIAQQAKETAVFLTMLSSTLLLLAAKPDDDDDKEEKNMFLIGSRMLDKLTDEISFYYNPLSLQQIAQGSYLPSLGLLTDGTKLAGSVLQESAGRLFGYEDWEKKAHPTKNFLRIIPVANQFAQTIIPMFDAEMATELGIKVSKESRR